MTSTRVDDRWRGEPAHREREHCHQIVLPSPILSIDELAKIRYIEESSSADGLSPPSSSTVSSTPTAPDAGAERLAEAIDARVRRGRSTTCARAPTSSSSRTATPTADLAAIPSLLLASAVHHRLVDEHLRTSAALIMEAGDVREVHHVALLLGFGASAVCPYLAYESIDALIERGELSGLSAFEARYQYGKALNKGIVKTMSKMGVSTVASYVGSQLFEAVGISDDVLARVLPGIHARASAASPSSTSPRASSRCTPAPTHRRSANASRSRNNGEYQWRRDGEIHLFNPAHGPKAPARHAREALRHLQGVHHAGRRPGRRAGDAARTDGPRAERDAACRSTRSRALLRSSSASAPARCPTDRSPKRRTRTLAIAMNRIGAQVQHRRRRRGRRALRHVRPERQPPLGDQAGRLGSIRRDQSLPRERRRHPDQDGPGRQAGRGRPVARAPRSTPGSPRPATRRRASASSHRRRTTTSTRSRTSPNSSTTSRTPTTRRAST